ncbi:MAG: ABC transporter substrate-binding protein, partial [Peptococcaceae bacterium]|nr:ABC transporter substrate-binding protein [Peptococcaceae bacterium]
MKRTLRNMALLLVLCLLLSACGQSGNPAPSAADPQAPPPAQGDNSAETVEIVDMGGRKVTLPAPDKLERLYPTGSTGLILLYTLAPDKMTAAPSSTGNAFSDDQKKFLVPEVHNLPSYGTLSGKGSLNLEEIKKADVQVILSMATSTVTESDISAADELQEQLQIPVVLFGGEMDEFAEAYRLLGKMIGREEDAEKIIAYCQDIVKTVEAVSAEIPEEERTTLYYAEGADGLATEPASSNRSIVFNKAGARNIAEVEALSGFGQSAVSMEQVLNWNPEVIIVQGGSEAYDIIKTDENWASIDAVKNGRVYKMSDLPFSWADRPPSVN